MKLLQLPTILFLASAASAACGSNTPTGGGGGNVGSGGGGGNAGSGGGGGNAGSGGGGGSAGSGDKDAVPDTAPVAACITVADDLIADFTTDNGLSPVDGRQGGFYVYGDSSGTFDPPNVDGQSYPIDSDNGNPTCSGPGSFHTKATGFSQWGAALGADFVPKVVSDAGSFKGTYDASKYKGVSFWAKAAAPISGTVQVSFPDVWTDASANPRVIDPTIPPCLYSTPGATNNCSPFLVKFADPKFPSYQNYKIDTTWRQYQILFADTQQDQYNAGFFRDGADYLDVNHLTAMAIQVNAIYTNGVAGANDFELWIDDVNFIE